MLKNKQRTKTNKQTNDNNNKKQNKKLYSFISFRDEDIEPITQAGLREGPEES